MKIYLAALYQSRLAGADRSRSGHMRACQMARAYPHMLESFHYMQQNTKMVDAIRADKRTVFLDSGAYSAFTQGVKIGIKEYGKFVRTNGDVIETAANLDVIGRGEKAAAATYRNQKTLEDLGAKVVPVHHVRDPDKWLEKYIAEGYDHLCLGGMVAETAPLLRRWLNHVWRCYLTNKNGTPRIKVHAFGLASLDLMLRHPWYSADATSWTKTAQYGGIYLDVPQRNGSTRDVKVFFSAKSSKRFEINSWHYDALTWPNKRVVLARLEELEAARIKEPDVEAQLEQDLNYRQGYHPTALAQSYGWRELANIEFFRRVMSRKAGVPC